MLLLGVVGTEVTADLIYYNSPPNLLDLIHKLEQGSVSSLGVRLQKATEKSKAGKMLHLT